MMAICPQSNVFRVPVGAPKMAGKLGEPANLDPGCLPRGTDVFNFYKQVRGDGIRQGRWKEGVVTIGEVVTEVTQGVSSLWSKTEIPSLCEKDPAAAEKEICKVVQQGYALLKIPIPRRKSNFGEKLNCLLDLAVCKHKDQQVCDCPAADKVPEGWQEYLADQRGPRKQLALLNRLRLRAATVSHPTVSLEEQEARKREMRSNEKSEIRETKREKARMKAEQENEILKRKVRLESSSEEEEDNVPLVEEDNEWEDFEEKVPEHNTLKLQNFSRECDRYKLSNRAAAKLGNAILIDVGVVTKKDCSLLLDHSKVRRERSRWGTKLEKSHSARQLPGGLYADGKKCPTLTRITNSVDVQVSICICMVSISHSRSIHTG